MNILEKCVYSYKFLFFSVGINSSVLFGLLQIISPTKSFNFRLKTNNNISLCHSTDELRYTTTYRVSFFMKLVSFLAFRQTIHSSKNINMISFPFVILLTQICLILTSISNYYDRKIWRRKFFHSAGLEIAVQCNAIHL